MFLLQTVYFDGTLYVTLTGHPDVTARGALMQHNVTDLIIYSEWVLGCYNCK